MASRSIVPELNFDWLAQLPQTIEQGRRQRVLQETLADLPDLNSASSVEQGAQRLFRAGLYDEGLKLYQAANARRAVDQRGAEMGLYLKWLEKGGPGKVTAPAAGEAVPDPSRVRAFDIGPGGAPSVPPTAPPTPGPDPFAGAVNPLTPAPGRRSELQAPVGVTPSNDIIERAQLAMAGGQGPQPGPQLAGPLPTPDTGPPQIVGGQLPGQAPPVAPGAPAGAPFMRGTGVPTAPAAPAAAPPAAPQVQPKYITPDPMAMARVNQLAQQLAATPRMATGAREAISAQLKSAINDLKIPKEDRQFMIDQAIRLDEGQDQQSYTRWKANQEGRKEFQQETIKASEDYENRFKKARDMQGLFTTMSSLAKNQNFITGNIASPVVKYGASVVNGLYDAATALGIDPGFKKEDIPLMNSAALMENFSALQKQAILAMMGSFGNNISNADVVTTQQMFPSLGTTSKGIELLSKIMSKMAEHSMEASRVARAYRNQKEGEATAPEMHSRVDNYYKEKGGLSILANPDGSLTELGKEVQDELSKRSDIVPRGVEAVQGYFRSGGAGVPTAGAGPAASPAPVPRRRPLESFQSEGEL